jgi:hypothetical protein
MYNVTGSEVEAIGCMMNGNIQKRSCIQFEEGKMFRGTATSSWRFSELQFFQPVL